MEQGIKLIDEQ